MEISIADVPEECGYHVRCLQQCFRFGDALRQLGNRDAYVCDVSDRAGPEVARGVVTIVARLPQAFTFGFFGCPLKIGPAVF